MSDTFLFLNIFKLRSGTQFLKKNSWFYQSSTMSNFYIKLQEFSLWEDTNHF